MENKSVSMLKKLKKIANKSQLSEADAKDIAEKINKNMVKKFRGM